MADNLNKEQAACLDALVASSQPEGEYCVPFRVIEHGTNYDRATVRKNLRELAVMGLAEFWRGLTTEDGAFAGAGYCATRAGIEVMEEIVA